MRYRFENEDPEKVTVIVINDRGHREHRFTVPRRKKTPPETGFAESVEDMFQRAHERAQTWIDEQRQATTLAEAHNRSAS